MFKRSISLILSCVLAFSSLFALSVTADAMDTANLTEIINAYSNKDIVYSISAQKPLKSLSSCKNEYTLYALSPYGYAILYDATGNLMEACYAEGAEAPIEVSSSEVYYYGGPFVYCTYADGVFTNTYDGEVLTAEVLSEASSVEASVKSVQSASLSRSVSNRASTVSTRSLTTYSVQPSYFSNLTTQFGENLNGTCTVVAAAILFGYYDNYVNDNFVATLYEDGVGTTEEFHQLLNDYVYGASSQEGIYIHDALPGLNSYLNTRNVCAVMNSEYSSKTAAINQIISSLQQGHPVIASMATLYGADWDHTVVIYSTNFDSSDPVGTACFQMHLGWYDDGVGRSETEFVASASWFYECGYINVFDSHNYSPYTSISTSSHQSVCSNCNHRITAFHEMTPWNRTSKHHSRSCTVCSYSEAGLHTYIDMVTGWYCLECQQPKPN